MQTSRQTISYGRHVHALATLGIPIIIGQLGTIIQGLADTIMVGHFSAHSLAAAGFVNNIMTLVLIFALGYSYAITPVVGPMHAREEFAEAGKALKAGLQANGLLGAALFLFMGTLYFFLDRMGQPAELLPEIRPYYLVVLVSLPVQSLFNAFKQFFDGIGHTRAPMWIMIGANVFNIVGNWLLIYGVGPFPQLGLLGAGISTTLSRVLMLAVIYGIFVAKPAYRKYHKGFSARDGLSGLRSQMHRLGRPLGLQMGMETASFSLCAVMQGWLGAGPLAAHQVMTNIGSTCFMIYYGIGAAVAIRVSHFHGLGDTANLRRTAFTGYGMILSVGIVLALLISTSIHEICSLFTDDAEIRRIVASLALPFVLYQLGDGLQINFGNALRGIADVRPLMRYAFLCYVVVSLPLSYLLGFTFGGGPAGIWMSYPVALTLAGALFLRRFLHQTRAAAQSPAHH